MRNVIEEVGEQKEEELRVLSTALHELAVRNVDLERQIVSLKSGNVLPMPVVKNTNTKVSQRV